MVFQSKVNTSAKASAIKAKNNNNACLDVTSPVASGRWAVRLTLPSTFLSAKSLITQPAARMRNTPVTNTIRIKGSGCPFVANHNAHKVGHSNKNVPMGLSIRINRI